MTSVPRITCPARLRGSLPKTHIMTAFWGRPGPTLVWSSHTREDQRRSDTEAPALLPWRLCHVCQAVPAFPLRTNCHPSNHAVLLHALRSAYSSATVSKGIARPPAQGNDQRITSHPTGETTKCRMSNLSMSFANDLTYSLVFHHVGPLLRDLDLWPGEGR